MKRALLLTTLLFALGSVLGIARATQNQAPPPGPGPSEDRVGFPDGYQNWAVLYVFDRPDNRQVRVIYGNAPAASWTLDEPFAYDSILVMETWKAQLDADSSPVLDDNGRFIKDELTGVFVMRKEPGFGQAYQDLRTGEWEYVAFKTDGTYSTPPQNSASCAKCHGDTRGENDWTYRTPLALNGGPTNGAVPKALIQAYTFVPGTLNVKAGTIVTWYNDDTPAHDIALDGAFDSGRMLHGTSFSYTFTTPGTYEYHCSIHAAMKATVVVQ